MPLEKDTTSRSLLSLALVAALVAAALSATPAWAATPGVQPVAAADVKAVASSTALTDNQPELVLDGRMGTAWVTDPGKAVGESVTLQFGTTRYLTRVDILPGYGKDSGTFKTYARPSRVRVAWDGGSQTFQVRDQRRYQTLALAGLARTQSLTITIEAVSGRTTSGAAISEVTPFEPEDVLLLDPALRSRIEADVDRLGEAGGAEALRKVVAYGRPAVPWLADRVARSSSDAGAQALAALIELDPATAGQLMARLLSEGTEAQAAVVLRGLRQQPSASEGIESALHTAATRLPGELALAALEQLAGTGDQRALPLLDAALGSADEAARALAAAHLGDFEEAGRAVAARHLGSDIEAVRLGALAALGAFDDEETVALVAPLAQHGSALTRQAAVRAMGRIHSPHARAELGRIIDSHDPATLDQSLIALIAHDGAAITMIRELLARGDEELSEQLFERLGRADGPGIRAMLVEMVVVEPTAAQSWYRLAVRALALHGRKGVVAVLDHLDDHPRSARYAAAFLERVADMAAPVASQRLVALGPDRAFDDLRVLLIETVERAGFAAAAKVVIRIYEDVATSDRVRRVALSALGSLPSPRSGDVALAAMAHPDVRISMVGMASAARLGDQRAIPIILDDLRERHVRDWHASSVEALGALKAADAVDIFRTRFGYASRPIQLAILRACQRIGGRGALTILVDATVHRDPAVSRAAQSLLSAQK